METYAYRLSEALAERGHRVTVVCQENIHECRGVDVIELPPAPMSRRRWRAMVQFNDALDQFFSRNASFASCLIHSHERTRWHSVSTFHGPPMSARRWYQFPSRRIHAWQYLERREVAGDNVRHVVPVSSVLRTQLVGKYPEFTDRFSRPINPGVSGISPARYFETLSRGRLKLLFVGREWRRKGLPMAVEVCAALNRLGVTASLDVYGTDRRDVPKNLSRNSAVTFFGWQPNVVFSDYDVLLHPAKSEPFGMVIAEALQSGCRAVITDACGAVDLKHGGCSILEVNAPISEWVRNVLEICNAQPEWEPIQTWSEVARQYEEVYIPLTV